MKLWMGPKRKGKPVDGLGPNVVESAHGRDRGPDAGPDATTLGFGRGDAYRAYRRMADGRRFGRTSVPPSRSRKHRGGR